MKNKVICILIAIGLILSLTACTNPNTTNTSATAANAIDYNDFNYFGDIEVDKEFDHKTSGDYEYYILDNGTISISEYKGSAENVEIPEKIKGKAVTRIGWSCFSGNAGIKSVVIPDSVMYIGSNAFCECENLENITIGDNVRFIGDFVFFSTAFYNNDRNWESGALYLRNYMISGYRRDDGCGGNVTIVDEVGKNYKIKDGTTVIADRAFAECSKLAKITMPDSLLTIGNDAFSMNNLSEVTIPDSVTYIGSGAFSFNEDLNSITIGKNVKCIGSDAFDYTAYYFEESNWENSVLYIGDYLVNGYLQYEHEEKAKESYPSGDYTVKDGTRVIADQAFWDCEDLTSVTMPDSVITIGQYAFACEKLSKVILSSGLTYIGMHAFEGCKYLKEITIPQSVTQIGEYALGFCYEYSKESDDLVYNKVSDFCVGCYKGTAGEKYAINNGLSRKYA